MQDYHNLVSVFLCLVLDIGIGVPNNTTSKHMYKLLYFLTLNPKNMIKVMLMIAEAKEQGASARVINFLESVLDDLIYEHLEKEAV